MSQLSRRRFLLGSLAVPLGAVIAACGDETATLQLSVSDDAAPAPAAPPATPEPFVISGEQELSMMAGTAYETPLYVFGSGIAGPITLVLGGVHGNEPGGWTAAERVVDEVRPASGALLVIPRANKLAIQQFVRTTDDLADLNRAYPGKPDGLPMERMAAEIVARMNQFHVSHVIDMHESWAFYKDRPQNGTAYLGQTVATYPTPPAVSLGQSVVDAQNQRIRAPFEEFFFRQSVSGNSQANPPSLLPAVTRMPSNGQNGQQGGSRSSLGLPLYVPGTMAFLVEMGQQQPLERRVQLHVELLLEFMRQLGSLT